MGNNIDYKDAYSKLMGWYQNISEINKPTLDVDNVRKAYNIAIYQTPTHVDEVFLQLCALNLLNVAIKKEEFAGYVSYDLVKSYVAKLLLVIDSIKDDLICYFYNKEESCLYVRIDKIVFSFRHVPLTAEILKASFSMPIVWPGVRLQQIAQPLLDYAISSLEHNSELKKILTMSTSTTVVEDRNIIDCNRRSIDYNQSIVQAIEDKPIVENIPNNERQRILQEVISVAKRDCSPTPDGWYDLVKLAPSLKQNGIDYTHYGFKKLTLFLEAIFGESMQRRNEGTMVYLHFCEISTELATESRVAKDKGEYAEKVFDILDGVLEGDKVVITSYGVIESGSVSQINKQFIQLSLANNRIVRIKRDAISSIELNNEVNRELGITPIDISFANIIVKNALVSESLYPSKIIESNATITMVESWRIWFTTDDGKVASCPKVGVIGYTEKMVKGQRVFVLPFKKEKAFCVILEMSYLELYEFFERLVLEKKDNSSDLNRSQILSILSFLIKYVCVSSSNLKSLKQRLKNIMSLNSSNNEDRVNDDRIEDNKRELQEDISQNSDSSLGNTENEVTIPSSEDKIKVGAIDKGGDSSQITPNVEKYKSELASLQGPKVIGTIDLTKIWSPKKKDEKNISSNETLSINSQNDLLPSNGKIIRMGATYGWIKPNDQDENLYFNTQELISYVGIIETPRVGDNIIYSLSKNAQGTIAVCIHKQCSRDIVEELIEKFHYNAKTCAYLKKRIDDFDRLNSEESEAENGLIYYLNAVGVNPNSFIPDEVERLFAENLSFREYATAIELLIDEVAKQDTSKCYNLFLRSISYSRSQKMFDVSKLLVSKALMMYKHESGKVKYFKGLQRTLVNRLEITEKTLMDNLEVSKRIFPQMPIYVRDAILTYKDFNGVTPDKETIRTGLYKEEYIGEVETNIKANKDDDLLYLTMLKLQLAFHSNDYNPKEDVIKFLVSRAKNILAVGDVQRYSEVRYLLRLSFRLKTFEGFDDTVGLYFMTLGNYATSEIDMYMGGHRRSLEELLKDIMLSDADNTLELTLLAESNEAIRTRIIREYEKIGRNTDGIDELLAVKNEIKKRYLLYITNPTINFMSFVSFLQSSSMLLNNERNIIENDSEKIVSFVTDFNTGQKYNVILEAYENIVQKVETIVPALYSHPTEIGYEIILPVLSTLKNNVLEKFTEIEQRVNPSIDITVLEAIGCRDTDAAELKIEIRNLGDSARTIHISRLTVTGADLIESNTINVDIKLPAGEDKLLNVEIRLCEDAIRGKTAEVEFEIDYDDIYSAIAKQISRNSKINKTINFESKTFVEIDNKFRSGAGGEELKSGDSMFYGRDAIIGRIQQTILSGSKNQIAIYGQKRSGKSSLLNQIMGKLDSDELCPIICGKFNLQGLPDNESNPTRWILESIAFALLRSMRNHGIKSLDKSFVLDLFAQSDDEFKALENFIEHLSEMDDLKGNHIVIIMDEYTYLYKLIKEGRVNEDFMRRWIAFIETPGVNLQAIVAAQDTLPHFMNESYASNYFNKFSREQLSYLSKEEALQLIKRPLPGVRFHNHSEELIYDYTSGSAFFTQIFCDRLVYYLNSEKRTNVVGKEEIETVAERLCTGTNRLDSSIFECLTKEADGSNFSEKDNIIVLKAIAELTRAGGYANQEDIKVNLSQEQLSNVLNNLYARRVITKYGDGYSINVKLFVKWIMNN